MTRYEGESAKSVLSLIVGSRVEGMRYSRVDDLVNEFGREGRERHERREREERGEVRGIGDTVGSFEIYHRVSEPLNELQQAVLELERVKNDEEKKRGSTHLASREKCSESINILF